MVTFKVDDLKNMNGALAAFCEELRLSEVDEDAVFHSRLVSCELISNVLRHGGVEACFTGGRLGNHIKITVSSEQFGIVNPNPTLPDVFAESGRGLYIVRTLCKGQITVDGGKITVLIAL